MLTAAVENDAEEAEAFDRMRGGDAEFDGSIEGLIHLVSGSDAAFMDAHGVPVFQDEAETEDATEGAAQSTKWTNEILDSPVHQHTKTSVRQLVYSVLRIGAGSVRMQQMDELIKTFKATMPDENNMPGCGWSQHVDFMNASCRVLACNCNQTIMHDMVGCLW